MTFLLKRKNVAFVQSLFYTIHSQCRRNSTAITFNMLRHYQKECIETTLKEFENGCNKQIVSLPVGSGKTVIMSNLIPRIPSPTPEATKVLLLAHRTELLDQAHNQILRYNPDLVVEIEQGNRKVNMDKADVIIASVPTLGRIGSERITKFNPDLFKAILIDEAHHSVAESYINILNYFGVNNEDNNNKKKKLLWGCTATAKRHDGLALNQVFDKITYHFDFMDMIEQGYLSQMNVTTIKTEVDLDAVRRTKADFVLRDLSDAVNTDARNQVIVSSWQKYSEEQDRKSTLVFAVDIAHTITLCNAFIDAGVDAKCITSKSNPIERLQILRDFRARKFPVLVNCAILTEGTDIPCVDCILLARPTRSATLFQQMFGRGLRLYPEKEYCLVIDFVDNFNRTSTSGLITIPTLLGLNAEGMITNKDILMLEKEAKEQEEAIENEEQEGNNELDPDHIRIQITEYDTLQELIADISVSSELRHITYNSWVNIGKDKYVLNVLNKGYLMVKRSKDNSSIWSASFRYQSVDTNFFGRSFDVPLESKDLSSAIRGADTWLQKKFSDTMGKSFFYKLTRSARFRKEPITESQIKALRRYNITIPIDMTKGQAMDLLTKLKFGQLSLWKKEVKLASLKQKEMKKKGEPILSRKKEITSF
ncbi:P-loop containing nucleoside triphosphate hydrolase protein [Cokeromyces recurvatus]|uniref:P-loop containing nucleoside triphosphate hydrolase protein n=1 Tax=Cokeromyces recurvatus TaxID=90255 RepID=UPI002220733D|nr:P-loop containing nucleoside triphosphate hydrolase protein [Cokeromyces recurvatus]KAI7899754.1 P-loop containing nucleoside triphosphate hydrolase protein [Cokeromyces recurvatus]